MAEKKKWIAGAIKHPGALTRSAHRAKESVGAFAREHEHDSGVTGKRARLAMTFRKMAAKRKSGRSEPRRKG